MNLQWISQLPSSYNNYLHSRVAELPGVDLTVHYVEQVNASYPWKTLGVPSLKYTSSPRWSVIDWNLLRRVTAEDTRCLVAGWRARTCVAVIVVLGLSGKRFAVWTDTPALDKRRGFLKRSLRHVWLQWVFRKATVVLGTGKPGIDALVKMGCCASKVVELPFFVDIDLYKRKQPRKLGARPVRFLSVARLEKSKGHEVALRAFAALVTDRGLQNWEYRIAGKGPEECRLRNVVKDLGLAERVFFLGWLEPDEVASQYHACDCLVHPSFTDPFPVVVLEAMASEMVVFGSSGCGSVKDRITDGINGYIHPPGSWKLLAEQLEIAVRTPTAIHALASEARKTSEEWPVQRGCDVVARVVQRLS